MKARTDSDAQRSQSPTTPAARTTQAARATQAVIAACDTRIGCVRAEAGPGGLRRLLLPEADTALLLRLPLPDGIRRSIAQATLTPRTLLSSLGLALPIVGPERLAMELPGTGTARSASRWAGADPEDVLASVLRDVKSLFEGELDPEGLRFDYPIDLAWCTDFTRRVMSGMVSIPPGAVTTYGALAAAAGSPRAARASGSVVGANPLGVVVPCHRVVGASGALTGFGGGLALKAALLALENVATQRN